MNMVQFRMSKINTEQFAILSETPPVGDIKLNTILEVKFSVELHSIAITLKTSFEFQEKSFLLLIISCEFEVLQTDWDSLKKDGKIIIPKYILETFAVQTIGTARGIMHCKTEGTPFNHFIIPPINATKLINGDLTIDTYRK